MCVCVCRVSKGRQCWGLWGFRVGGEQHCVVADPIVSGSSPGSSKN